MTNRFVVSSTRVVVCVAMVAALIGSGFAVKILQQGRPQAAGAAGSDLVPGVHGRKPPTVPATATTPKPPTVTPFTVNTTVDLVASDPHACQNNVAGQCSLRQAIIEANAQAGADTIMVPAGTYQLIIADGGADAHDATQGELSITDGVSIIGDVDGGGNPATIIQACDAAPAATATGCPDANGIADKILSINPGHDKTFDTQLSNLEIRFGMNLDSFTTDGSGGGIAWDGSSTVSSGAGTLTITNCNIHDNVTTDGPGGGLALSNAATAAGTLVTINNSTIAGNVAHRASPDSAMGGGISLGSDTSLIMTNSKVLNNSANDLNSSGGGIAIQAPSAGQPAPNYQIHGGTISGNHAALDGGGILTSANLNIDQGATLSNNTAGRNGGGLWSNIANLPAAQQVTLSKVTITGNTATGDGGGIHVDAGDSTSGNNLTVTFSRLANNTGATGGNLGNVAGVVTVVNNWWGSNAPAGGINDPSSAVTFDPFIVLKHTANPNPAHINQTSILTADMSADNHGNGAALSGNLDVFSGVPATINNAALGTIADAQPESLNAGAQATATFNAGPTAGPGSADVTVDQQTVRASVTMVVAIAPTISKLFLPDKITVGGTTLLSFTIVNPNSDPNPNVTLTGVQFTDNLPAGVVVASPNQVTSNCGGTVTADPGSSSISLSGGTIEPQAQLRPQLKRPVVRKDLVASGACFVSVEVQAVTAGTKDNTSGPASSDQSGPGAPSNTATLEVITTPLVLPPTALKLFGTGAVSVGANTSLTFVVANPNPIPDPITDPNSNTILTNVGLKDPLPAGLVVATPNGLSGNCTGNVSAISGSSTIELIGLSLDDDSFCVFSVNVTATTGGLKTNTTTPVSATFDDGTGNFHLITGNSASAVLQVLGPSLNITKIHAADFHRREIGATYTITVSNDLTAAAPTFGTISVTDILPSVNNTLVATAIAGLGWTCNLGSLTCTRSDSLAPGGSYPPITLTVNVPQNIRANVVNTATVSGGGDPNSHTAYDPTHIGPPVDPQIR